MTDENRARRPVEVDLDSAKQALVWVLPLARRRMPLATVDERWTTAAERLGAAWMPPAAE